MDNKVLIILMVPELDQSFDIMIPVSRKIGNIIEMITKILIEVTEGNYTVDLKRNLYNKENNIKYDPNALIINTDIRNGTTLVLF